ncbi:MAG: hypothetical protein QOD72_3095 [Acidimicrobiaceae bacterium]|nr:hypothetical protein [Acidimicrobiaceae bacterium]
MKADMAKQSAITRDVKRYIWLHNIEPLIRGELVEEHRRNPLGHHSAELDMVLYFLRGDPLPDDPRLVVVIVKPEREWAIGEHSRQKGVPVLVREGIYESVEEIEHAVFLERLAAVRATYGSLEAQV